MYDLRHKTLCYPYSEDVLNTTRDTQITYEANSTNNWHCFMRKSQRTSQHGTKNVQTYQMKNVKKKDLQCKHLEDLITKKIGTVN